MFDSRKKGVYCTREDFICLRSFLLVTFSSVLTVSMFFTPQICPLTMQNLVLGCLVDLCENIKVKSYIY